VRLGADARSESGSNRFEQRTVAQERHQVNPAHVPREETPCLQGQKRLAWKLDPRALALTAHSRLATVRTD
jgi:hypothetical protein